MNARTRDLPLYLDPGLSQPIAEPTQNGIGLVAEAALAQQGFQNDR